MAAAYGITFSILMIWVLARHSKFANPEESNRLAAWSKDFEAYLRKKELVMQLSSLLKIFATLTLMGASAHFTFQRREGRNCTAHPAWMGRQLWRMLKWKGYKQVSTRTKSVLLSIGSLLLIISGMQMAARAQTRNVNVVNTPTVHVTNTPSVNVANTANVSVTNIPSVKVANIPVTQDFDSPLRHGYQVIVDQSGKCPTGGTNICFLEFGSVPPGHRIVIQHISGFIGFSGNPNAMLVLLNNGSGNPVSSFFAPLAPTVLFSAFDQTALAYFESGQIIEAQVDIIGGAFSNQSVAVMTVSGYVIDCGAGPEGCSPLR